MIMEAVSTVLPMLIVLTLALNVIVMEIVKFVTEIISFLKLNVSNVNKDILSNKQ